MIYIVLRIIDNEYIRAFFTDKTKMDSRAHRPGVLISKQFTAAYKPASFLSGFACTETGL